MYVLLTPKSSTQWHTGNENGVNSFSPTLFLIVAKISLPKRSALIVRSASKHFTDVIMTFDTEQWNSVWGGWKFIGDRELIDTQCQQHSHTCQHPYPSRRMAHGISPIFNSRLNHTRINGRTGSGSRRWSPSLIREFGIIPRTFSKP